MRGPAARRPTNRFPPNARLPLGLRWASGPNPVLATVPHARDAKLARLEAALFLADEPLTARKLASAAALGDTAEARRLIDFLRELYDSDATAYQIEEIAGGYQLLTRPAYRPWLVRAQRTGTEVRLSGAALETLAVVAYRQPIMRADVEAIRGVGCGELLTHLMEKGLIKIVGRHQSLGRPVLYGTTRKFLQAFGLGSLKDLPDYQPASEAGSTGSVDPAG
jgi:segregation and condensation protein B